MVSWLDLLPTLLQVAGGDLATVAPGIDGKSFADVLDGSTDQARDRVFATHSGDGSVNFYPCRSVRLGQWKYIRNLASHTEFHTHIDPKPGDTRYWPSWVKFAKTDAGIASLVQQYLHRPPEELYDLSSDPDELKNLAAEPAHAPDLKRLRDALQQWMDASGDKGIASDIAAKPPGVKVPADVAD